MNVMLKLNMLSPILHEATKEEMQKDLKEFYKVLLRVPRHWGSSKCVERGIKNNLTGIWKFHTLKQFNKHLEIPHISHELPPH